jgi:hypothetical protein
MAAVFLTGWCWAVASPLISSPDDDLHVSAAWCAWGFQDGVCEYQSSLPDRDIVQVPALAEFDLCFALEGPSQSAACQVGKTSQFANGPGYPNGFYSFMRLFAGDDAVRSAIIMRVASFIVCALMITGAALLLLPRERWRVLLVTAAAGTPLAIFLFASNNPSGVAIAAELSAFLATVAMLRQKTWTARALVGLVTAGYAAIAAASRPDGFVLSAVCVGIGLAVALPLGRRPILTGGLLVVGLVLAGLALIVTRSPLESSGLNLETLPTWAVTALSSVDYYLSNRAATLGWLDTVPPSIVGAIKPILLGIALAAGFRIVTPRRIFSTAVVVTLALGIPTYWVLGGGFSLQPRYVLAVLLVLFAALVLDLGRSRATLSVGQAMTTAALASFANAVALHFNIRRYVTGTDVVSANLDKGKEWWWDGLLLGPNAVWIIGSLSFAVMACSLAWLASRPTVDSDTDSSARNPTESHDEATNTQDSSLNRNPQDSPASAEVPHV